MGKMSEQNRPSQKIKTKLVAAIPQISSRGIFTVLLTITSLNSLTTPPGKDMCIYIVYRKQRER